MRSILLFNSTITSWFISIGCFLKYSLHYILSIRTFYRTPRIVYFQSSEQILVKGGILKLEWKVKYAAFVHISGLGYFLNAWETALPIHFNSTSFTITAISFLKKTKKMIEVSSLERPLLIATKPKLNIAFVSDSNIPIKVKTFQIEIKKQKWKFQFNNQ